MTVHEFTKKMLGFGVSPPVLIDFINKEMGGQQVTECCKAIKDDRMPKRASEEVFVRGMFDAMREIEDLRCRVAALELRG